MANGNRVSCSVIPVRIKMPRVPSCDSSRWVNSPGTAGSPLAVQLRPSSQALRPSCQCPWRSWGNANFSQSFLCNSFHVGDNVSVWVFAYNATYSGDTTYFPIPWDNITTLSQSQITNSSKDVSTTFGYGATTVSMDVIGRDYQVLDYPDSCSGF